MNYFQDPKSGWAQKNAKMLANPCQFSQELMLYFCRNVLYSNHLVDYASEWTRDKGLKNTNKYNELVEAATITLPYKSMA